MAKANLESPFVGRYVVSAGTLEFAKTQQTDKKGVSWIGKDGCGEKRLVSPVDKLMTTRLMFPLFLCGFYVLKKAGYLTQMRIYTTKSVPSQAKPVFSHCCLSGVFCPC